MTRRYDLRLMRGIVLASLMLAGAQAGVATHVHAQAPRVSIEDEPREIESEEIEHFRAHNTWFGPVGGFFVADAGSASPGSFRLQLGIEFFAKNGFLLDEDEHSRIGGTLSFSWTIHDMVEAYASLVTYANNNRREFPDLFLVLGDAVVGTKVFRRIKPWLSVGGDVAALLPTGTGLGVGLDGVGALLRANLSTDLRGLAKKKIPFIARLNLGYRFDRSENLIDSVETERFDQLSDPRPIEEETRHLISRVERYALNVNRTDFFDVGLGFEAPIGTRKNLSVHPILEWTLGVPVNRQGFDCPRTAGSDGADGCLRDRKIRAFPMKLTLGVRVLPPVTGLATFLAVDVGLTGTKPRNSVHELAATAPYRILLGLSYARDARLPDPIVETEIKEVSASPPVTGRLRGRVRLRTNQRPVSGAVIHFPGTSLTAQRADDQGRFVTYPFRPGRIRLRVTHEGYQPGSCEGLIGEKGGDTTVVCELEPRLVQVDEDEVVILEQIHFAFDSDEILPRSFPLMGQIAQALRDHPQILEVEIQGHTDNVGTPEYNEDLSQRRASSVRTWLVENGIAPDRLRARGYGLSRPEVPNIVDRLRAKNRRVEFKIVRRKQ